jgi:hypothetical protein
MYSVSNVTEGASPVCRTRPPVWQVWFTSFLEMRSVNFVMMTLLADCNMPSNLL